MKRKNLSGRFWTGLTSFNLIAIAYPYRGLVQADSNDARYLAAVIYFGALLVLAVVDLITVKLASA